MAHCLLQRVAAATGGLNASPGCRLATFYSRSRGGRWCKGETSGHFINVHNVYTDCDRDSLIYLSDPIGPACHTGARCASIHCIMHVLAYPTRLHAVCAWASPGELLVHSKHMRRLPWSMERRKPERRRIDRLCTPASDLRLAIRLSLARSTWPAARHAPGARHSRLPEPTRRGRTCWFKEVELEDGPAGVQHPGAHDSAGNVPHTTLFALEQTIAGRRAALAQPTGAPRRRCLMA